MVYPWSEEPVIGIPEWSTPGRKSQSNEDEDVESTMMDDWCDELCAGQQVKSTKSSGIDLRGPN